MSETATRVACSVRNHCQVLLTSLVVHCACQEGVKEMLMWRMKLKPVFTVSVEVGVFSICTLLKTYTRKETGFIFTGDD